MSATLGWVLLAVVVTPFAAMALLAVGVVAASNFFWMRHEHHVRVVSEMTARIVASGGHVKPHERKEILRHVGYACQNLRGWLAVEEFLEKLPKAP